MGIDSCCDAQDDGTLDIERDVAAIVHKQGMVPDLVEGSFW
jgi:hypothetical protein